MECREYGRKTKENYKKQYVLNFEMHTALFGGRGFFRSGQEDADVYPGLRHIRNKGEQCGQPHEEDGREERQGDRRDKAALLCEKGIPRSGCALPVLSSPGSVQGVHPACMGIPYPARRDFQGEKDLCRDKDRAAAERNIVAGFSFSGKLKMMFR